MPYTIIGDIGELELNTNIASWRETEDGANPCVILTLNNDVIFCGNIVIKGGYTSGMPFATLPESMRPAQTVKLSCIRGTSTDSILQITPAGSISLLASFTNAIALYLSGISFNCSSQYYNPTIGNIYNNGTSPLSEV